MGEPQRRMRMLGSSIRRPGDEQELHFTNATGDDVIMERGYYRDSMMLPAIKAATDPDELGARLFEALRDSFGPDIVEDAYRLIGIDPNAERSHCTYAQALLQAGDPERAAMVLDAYAQSHPPSAWAALIRNIIAAQKEDWTDALHWATEILRIEPEFNDGLARLASCAFEVGGDKLRSEYIEWAAQIGCQAAVHALAQRSNQSPSS